MGSKPTASNTTAQFKPLFYLNQGTLLTYSKTQLLAPDCYSISSVFSFIVAQNPHYICGSRGKFTPCKTPLFWHKNKKALLLSKQLKSILLAEMPAKWLLGHQCPRSCWRWRREPQPPGEAARLAARSHPQARQGQKSGAARAAAHLGCARSLAGPQGGRRAGTAAWGPRLRSCEHCVPLPGACCLCREPWGRSEIKSKLSSS